MGDAIIGTILINHVNPESPPYTHWVTYSAISYANLTDAQQEALSIREEEMIETDPILECTTRITGEFSFYERLRDDNNLARYCSVCAPHR